MVRLTHENFIKKIKSKDVELQENYVSYHTPILVKCTTCGYTRKVPPQSLIYGKGCPYCKGLIKNTDTILAVAENHNITLSEKYINAKTHIACKCNICNYEWKCLPRLIKKGCPKCENKKKLKYDEFICRIGPDIDILGDYKNTDTPVLCKCKRCGHEWNARPYHLFKGHGCPECAYSNTSFVEQFLFKAFADVLGEEKVKSRERKTIGKELDIYIPSLGMAIEPGTWKFHKTKQQNDLDKLKLCNNKGIKLIIIYYECRGERPDYPELQEYIYDNNLANNKKELITLLGELFRVAEIDVIVSEEWICSLEDYAYKKTRRLTTEEFKKNPNINKNIEIIGEFKGASRKVKCKCKICNSEWEATAASLMDGRGCKLCSNRNIARSRLKSTETFITELADVHPNIEVLGEYTGAGRKVSVKCNVCGYEWESIPNHLLRKMKKGNGCPKCSRGIHRTHEQFVIDMETVNENIEIKSTFVNTRTKVECICKICGYNFSKLANDLLRGSRCPKCAGKKMN